MLAFLLSQHKKLLLALTELIFWLVINYKLCKVIPSILLGKK